MMSGLETGSRQPRLTREEARRIAEAYLGTQGSTRRRVQDVYLWHEIVPRKPTTYGIPLEQDHWIAYVDRPVPALGASLIVAVHAQTGDVTYFGAAQDEG